MDLSNTNIEEPPQGLSVPMSKVIFPKHEVIKLGADKVDLFQAGLSDVRKSVPSHWMKDKDHSDLVEGNTVMLAIEQDGELKAGALVTTFRRQLGNKLYWYPWESNGHHTGLIGSVWVKAAKQGMGKALLDQAIQEIKTSTDITGDPLRNGLRYAMAGIAADNQDSRDLFNAKGFQQVGREKADPNHGKPMVYVRLPILAQ
jgi:GNAT superfamily N-acetyltransferase